MNRVAKNLQMNQLAPVHDTNREKANRLHRGSLLLLRSVASKSHLRRASSCPQVVPFLLPPVPRPRAKERGGTPHTFKSTRT